MAKRVTQIPATLNRFTSTPVYAAAKRKVAGYARVSTDQEEQQSSYEAQMDYYRSYITSRSDWEFVGMYSDEDITATNTKHRDGFNSMIEDALAGKINLIITKSISRFARNTVDSLTTVRKLKDKGVEIFFEKENIWTLDSKGELLITIMSSLAQEESRSISENTTWGKRKSFADGKASVAFTHFLGYDKGFDVNEEEADTVRLIYKLFLAGLSLYAITKELERRGCKAPSGGDSWHISTVRSILTNEKYRGDALL
ncbi:MAG: recombinase family protein, partial [Lachnospiraceae bacterium]|nr:recombinase family protein [Lachnospiraceae bacterium]